MVQNTQSVINKAIDLTRFIDLILKRLEEKDLALETSWNGGYFKEIIKIFWFILDGTNSA